MSYCNSCTDLLVITAGGDLGTVNGEGSSRGTVTVVDDIELICGHHFHWSCFSDAYAAGRKTTCPHCNANILDPTENKLLVTLRSGGGEERNFDIGKYLDEEAREEAIYEQNPELRRVRAFLEFCAAGNNEAIMQMLKDDQSILGVQDFETNQTGLHIAVQNRRDDTVLLLLQQGADRNAKDIRGNTFIDIARQMGASEELLAKLRSS